MNLQLDHLPKYDTTKPPEGAVENEEKFILYFFETLFSPKKTKSRINPQIHFCAGLVFLPLQGCERKSLFFCFSVARPSQRVAMDDLASYFVEERSKVR